MDAYSNNIPKRVTSTSDLLDLDKIIDGQSAKRAAIKMNNERNQMLQEDVQGLRAPPEVNSRLIGSWDEPSPMKAYAQSSKHYKKNKSHEKDHISCLDIFQHIQECPVCSQLYSTHSGAVAAPPMFLPSFVPTRDVNVTGGTGGTGGTDDSSKSSESTFSRLVFYMGIAILITGILLLIFKFKF